MERDRHGIGRSPVQRELSFLAGRASWMKDRCRPEADNQAKPIERPHLRLERSFTAASLAYEDFSKKLVKTETFTATQCVR